MMILKLYYDTKIMIIVTDKKVFHTSKHDSLEETWID